MSHQVALSEVCSTLTQSQSPALVSDDYVWHMSIPAFDESGAPELVPPGTIGSNKLLITRPCILFSRLNPRIPRVWDITTLPTDHPSLASTEFVPFVVEDSSRLEPRYLYWFLQSKRFVTKARAGVRAATKSRERVEKERLFEIPISLPPLAEQRRIAAVLDKADGIRRKRRESLRLLDEFLRSAFLEMFGDPVRNQKGWGVVRFGDVLLKSLRNGLSPSKGGAVTARVLTLTAITGSRFEPTAVKTAQFAHVPAHDQLADASDFLICRGNGNRQLMGRAKFPLGLEQGTIFPDTIIAARVDLSRVERSYLEAVWDLAAVRRDLERGARTTSGIYKVNQGVLMSLHFPLPPIGAQRRFAEVRDRVKRLRERSSDRLHNRLFDSLAQRAFQGKS